MKKRLVLMALFAFAPAFAAETPTGSTDSATDSAKDKGFLAKIFDRGDRSKPMYLYVHEPKTEGEKRIVKNTFATPDGKEIAVENIEFNDGRLKSYQQIQKQVGADGKIEVQGGDVVFTYTQDGKTKTSKEKLKDNFVVGPSLVGYLQGRWDQVAAGKDVDVRFGVVDRRETVGFTLKKEKEVDVAGQKAIVVKMKPTSFVIAALVNPIHFTFAGSKQVRRLVDHAVRLHDVRDARSA
jgi:hypothetical protein